MTEAEVLSEQMEDNALISARRSRRASRRRTSYLHFGIRFSQWGREYKSYCYSCDYESGYGTRGKVVKSAIAHVTAAHAVDGGEEL